MKILTRDLKYVIIALNSWLHAIKKGEITMKKVLSVLICVMMLASVLCMAVSAADYATSADGDVLYEVKFNESAGFVPATLIDDKEGHTVEISEDGKTVKLSYNNVTKGKWYWGGSFEGLEIGEGKTYTLSGKIQIEGTNAGVYYNVATSDLSNNYKKMYGVYGGRADNNDMSLIKGGNKHTGSVLKEDGTLVCDGTNYAKYDFQAAMAANEDGFCKLDIVIDGWDYAVYFNGVLFDKHIGTADEFAAEYANTSLGFGAYLYNKNSALVAKDFVLYKGDTVNVATEPETPVDTTPATEPTAPSTGDKSAVIVAAVALVALLGTAVTVKTVREK